MRTYSRTHGWISFELDLTRLPWTTWMLLGEAQSKLAHLAGVPLQPDTAEKLHLLYLAKGALATTAIEGNTLSEDEVIKLLQGDLKLPPSKQYLAQEIDNVVRACNSIWNDGPSRLTPELIKEFNQRVLQNLSVAEEVVPGQVRRHEVGVMRYRGAPPEDCEYLLGRLCGWLEEPAFQGTEETRAAFSVLRAIVAHLYIAWIHPFGDGNGRTARLVEFEILVAAGVPAPAAHLLSNHYNETRTEYYRQLDYASKSGGDVTKFLHYAIQGFVDKLREQISYIKDQQHDVAWRNYIYDVFALDASPTAVRQRMLLLDLSTYDEPVDRRLLSTISPRVAAAYFGKTQKTLSRDVNELAQKQLLEIRGPMCRPRKELILAFLPKRHPPANDTASPRGRASSAAIQRTALQMKQLALPFSRRKSKRR